MIKKSNCQCLEYDIQKIENFCAKVLCNTTDPLKVCWLANARQEKGVLKSMQKTILLHAISVVNHVVQ